MNTRTWNPSHLIVKMVQKMTMLVVVLLGLEMFLRLLVVKTKLLKVLRLNVGG